MPLKSDRQESNTVIEVFKTNISNKQMAAKILEQLSTLWPDLKVNFDLEDCDNILRVESTTGNIEIQEITKMIAGLDRTIEILE